MMEMQESVARAIAKAHIFSRGETAADVKGKVLTWEEHIDIIWPLFLSHARAAMNVFYR
jgi:hypothetical protein